MPKINSSFARNDDLNAWMDLEIKKILGSTTHTLPTNLS